MRAKEFSDEYEAKLRLLDLPESKADKIIYFLWLDDQVMEIWSEYLNMKCFLADNSTQDKKHQEKMNKKLLLVDHFEMYLDALRLHITYDEIDAWTLKNNYWKRYIYNRF